MKGEKTESRTRFESYKAEPGLLVESGVGDEILNYQMSNGRPADDVTTLDESSITFQANYKTGDGMDCPYDGSKEGYKAVMKMLEDPLLSETEGYMQWNGLFICHQCDGLFDTEVNDYPEITEGETRECPNCGSSNDIVLATAPKWLYFTEMVEFEEEVNDIESLERELSRIFGKEISV